MIVQIIGLQVNIGSKGISNFSLFISFHFFLGGGGDGGLLIEVVKTILQNEKL